MASSFLDADRCFLDDALTGSSNLAHLFLILTSMAASSTTTHLLLSTTMAFLHDGQEWRHNNSGGAQAWSRAFNNGGKHPHPHRGKAPNLDPAAAGSHLGRR
jgi:hypothetical protein